MLVKVKQVIFTFGTADSNNKDNEQQRVHLNK